MIEDDDELNVEELKVNRICVDCVGEDFLRAEIERLGTDESCSYCSSDEKTLALDDFVDYVDAAFEQHFHRTSPNPDDGLDYLMAKEGKWERRGERAADAIAEAAHIDDKPAEHARQILNDRHEDFENAQMGEEDEFDADAHYEEGPVEDFELQADWRRFQHSLQTEARLFNAEAAAIIGSIFEGLEGHTRQTKAARQSSMPAQGTRSALCIGHACFSRARSSRRR